MGFRDDPRVADVQVGSHETLAPFDRSLVAIEGAPASSHPRTRIAVALRRHPRSGGEA